ncbi:MAG: hypothetical protein LBR64_08235, partial [Dysgonamonadaceae bacterium]|jgi:hypothetical protein|nr:hypothetical protein [Dysgonamonadaceae bacterium]
MARTFRSKGFQWITQFAYDPMDLAYSNTEYQTHFLNLAYTPQKALSMKIAAEVARAVPRLAACPKYPADTVFGNFRVSYAQNLSEMNSKTKFFYSNNTDTQPISPQNLEEIAGFGNSPIVSYEGCGAYFLDRLGKGFWRLEVMPDAVQTSDPFAKASLKKRVVEILRNTWKMKILIPDLGKTFSIKALNAENTYNSESKDGGFMIRPGVYLLETKGNTESAKWASDSKWKNIRLGEFVAPESSVKNFMLVHNPPENAETGKALPIEAQIIGAEFPDSVLIYSDKISFWFDKNPYLKMERSSGYAWKAEIPEKWLTDGLFRYNAVVCKGDKRFTFPSGEEGSPLDWDFYNQKYYEIRLNEPDSPVLLFSAGGNANNLETYSIPAQGFALRKLNSANPAVPSRLDFELKYQNPETRFFWRKYVKNEMENRKYGIENAQNICLQLSVNGVDTVNIGLITSDGFTYSAIADLSASESVLKIPLDRLKQAPTALLPQPYPVFLDNHFVPDVQIPFDKRKIEMFEISVSGLSAENAAISLGNIWLE